VYEPIKLAPAFKDYIWGGSKLSSSYNKRSNTKKIAESWELSTHEDGHSTIASGKFAGLTLKEYIKMTQMGLVGTKADSKDCDIPILIKFIDAADDLSIQVHPDNEYARSNECDNGKTEMWVILDSEPDAFLYVGTARDISKDELESAINKGEVTSLLRKVPVKKGDVFFIPAGTIHAIGKGIVICEIQQRSNVTYRMYDYDRIDESGAKRPLHVKKALDVANLKVEELNTKPEFVLTEGIGLLRSCPHFSAYCYSVYGSVRFKSSKISFIALICLNGSAKLLFEAGSLDAAKGDTFFLPAQDAEYELKGTGEFILITL
jgi:mannose-6-phosphate isomerase